MSQSGLSVKLPSERPFHAAPVAINWNPGLPIFASPALLKSAGGDYGWIGGADASGRQRCILPYTIISKAGWDMVRFRTATIPLNQELEREDEKSFLNSVVEYFRSTGADLILPSGNSAIFRAYPDGAAVAPYGTFVSDLTQPEDVLRSAVRKTYRQNIRKAEAAGVRIRCGLNHLDAAYELVAETLKRSGVAFRSYNQFKRRVMALGENVKIFVAEYDGEPHGCVVSPFSTYAAYNWYAGSRPEPVLGAMHLLHWEAMRHFRSLGVRSFDFQGVRIDPEKGSKQEGITTYKRGFGGRFVQGFTWKYSLRPLKSVAYTLGVRLFMGGDVVDQERHKLTHTAGAG